MSGTAPIAHLFSVGSLRPGPLQLRFFFIAHSVSSQAPYRQCSFGVAAKVQICSFQCCIADTISPSVRDYFRAKTLLALNPHCLFACFLFNSSSDRFICWLELRPGHSLRSQAQVLLLPRNVNGVTTSFSIVVVLSCGHVILVVVKRISFCRYAASLVPPYPCQLLLA